MNIASLILAVLAAIAIGQQPSRDRGAAGATPAGTGRIAGRAIDTEPQPQPVRRAIVTLTGTEIPRGRTTVSDDQGRFAFENLPAGRFTLAGTKAAYLAGVYGASRPGGAGVPVQLGAGERLGDLSIVMPRGAVITGTVVDDRNEPAPNLQVVAFRVPLPGAPPTLVTTASATTDDLGAYRIYGLSPGRYVVASALRRGGTAGDVMAMPVAEIDNALRDLQRRTGLVMAATPPPPAVVDPVPPGTYAYSAVFYPGVASAAGATPIALDAGEERGGIDFTVRYTRMARIEGAVRNQDGSVPAVRFSITSLGAQLPALLGNVATFSTEIGQSGRTFRYTNVAPGSYTITAYAASPAVMWARAEVEIADRDVAGLSLVMQPAVSMRGRLVFDGAALPPPDDPSVARVLLLNANGLGQSAANSTTMGNFPIAPAVVGADGRFEIHGIIPDTYRLTSNVAGAPGWWLRSAIVNGRDVLDHPFEIGAAASITGAVLTFSDRHSQLSGVVTTAAGQIAPAYYIAVFPADPALWRPPSRRVTSARTGTDGRWIVKDLPPGEYLIAALRDLGPEDLLDPAFLQSLVGVAVKLSLGDGEQKVQDLRLGGS